MSRGIWSIRDIYPDAARNFYAAENGEGVEFGRIFPDAHDIEAAFGNVRLSEAYHHKKYINEYSLKWWLECLPKREVVNAIHR